MATIWQKFPAAEDIRKAAKIYPVGVRFDAPLVGGKFTFANQSVKAFKGNPRELYVLDGVTISGNIDGLQFCQAINPGFGCGLFSLNIDQEETRLPVTQAPFLFGNYDQALEFCAQWQTETTVSEEDTFRFILNGELVQTPAILAAGLAEISLFVTANIIRLDSNKFMG